MVAIPSLDSRIDNEHGAETVQLAFALPLLFLLLMGTIQLCIMAFFTLTLAGSTEQAAWDADVSLLQTCGGSESASTHIEELLLERTAFLEGGRLQVSNATYSTSSPYSYKRSTRVANNRTLTSENGTERFEVRQLYREVNAGLVEFDVSYRLPSIINLPGLSGVAITRHVARERIISTRTEIR